MLSKANHTILDLPKCSLNITVEMPNTTNFDASDKLIQTQRLTGLASMSVLSHPIPCPVYVIHIKSYPDHFSANHGCKMAAWSVLSASTGGHWQQPISFRS